MMMKAWQGKLSRVQAIGLLDRATDKDDTYWEDVVEDYYDEDTDTMPSIYDVFAALGVTKEEYLEAHGPCNVDWPVPPASKGPTEEDKFKQKVIAELQATLKSCEGLETPNDFVRVQLVFSLVNLKRMVKYLEEPNG